jgi:hypothetical protein
MRQLVFVLLCSCLLGVAAHAQANSPRELSDAEAAQIEAGINKIKNLPARRLDRRLPRVALADWLQTQAGPSAKMSWVYRSDLTAGSKDWQDLPDEVEADIALNDRQSIMLEVAVTHCDRQIIGCQRHVPSIFRVDVITGKNAITGRFESTELARLSDLPHFLERLRQGSSEAER